MPLRRISADEFARRLKDTSRESDKRFAFFLGAGCSVTSDIPAAGGLVRDHWLPRLKGYRAPHRNDHDAWVREELPEYDSDNPGACYGAVMEKLFFQPEERQREIERLCEGRFPGFGYATLASLMAMEGGTFNVVLTTNFDDLVADALYLFTKARPLIIHHESLASYIRPTRTRPLVVKLHGDNRLTPQNTSDETERLQVGMERQVRPLLDDRGLIFIGYGGNDNGIARMLEKLPPEALPLGVYWVSGQEPDCLLREWLDDRNAMWVEKGDFDEFMLLIRNAFDLPHPEKKRFEDVFERYTTTYKDLSRRITALPDAVRGASALKEAVKRTDQSFPDWWAVELEASRLVSDAPDQADMIYQRGLNQFPLSASLLGNYAVFLENVRQDYDEAEKYYRRALAADPSHVSHLGNYAFFLEKVRKDYDRAEEYFKRALAIDSEDAHTLSSYALFLQHVRKDNDGAERYFNRAVNIDGENANILCSYAIFLEAVRNDYDAAEEYYRRALTADPEDATNLAYYGDLLEKVRQDYDGAEEHYKRALSVDPENVYTLRNYARLLENVREDYDGADELYRRALARVPTDAYWHGQYALFLQYIRQDLDGAEEYYRRAAEIVPVDAYSLGNYALFLENVREDYDRAEDNYKRAIDADPEDVYIVGAYASFLEKIRKNYTLAEDHYRGVLDTGSDDPYYLSLYATFLKNVRKDFDGARDLFERALALDPNNGFDATNYAGLLLGSGRKSEGLSVLESALKGARGTYPAIQLELLFYLFANGPDERQGDSIVSIKQLVEEGNRSLNSDYSLNILRAKQEGHAYSEWLEPLAAVITAVADLSTLDAWDAWKNA